MICPFIVPRIARSWGWDAAFYIVGASGILWLILWALTYDSPDRHPRVSPLERAYVQETRISDNNSTPAPRIPWLRLFTLPATWAYTIGMLLTGPVWWFYLFWIPDFFEKRFTLTKTQISYPIMVLYFVASFGSIGGGWLAAFLLGRGFSVANARKISLFFCALCVIPVIAAPYIPNLWVAVIVVGIAASAHQGWSANLYTLVSDNLPRHAVSSVVGIGGMASGFASVIVAQVVGFVLEATHSYATLFAGACAMYLLSILAVHLLIPRTSQPAAPLAFP
jgi:ACS family hexuronate transporter-like MFS transporter